MKKQQYILLSSALAVFVLLFFFGKTTPDKKKDAVIAANRPASATLSTNDILADARKKLSSAQQEKVTQLENAVVRGDVKEQKIKIFTQLANFWGDTIHQHQLSAYYLGESAKLENSEKNLTFAAHLMVDDLLAEDNPAMQNWLATNAKALFESSLQLNPANDSSKIGLGACYMFGNISDNPMQGILAVRQVVEKNPGNLYGQMMLGLGGIRSGQLDKAIERFQIVVNKQPDNLEAIFHLAETYDRKGDKINAVKWYRQAVELISVPEAKKEIEDRIKALQ